MRFENAKTVKPICLRTGPESPLYIEYNKYILPAIEIKKIMLNITFPILQSFLKFKSFSGLQFSSGGISSQVSPSYQYEDLLKIPYNSNKSGIGLLIIK
ncbi:MAG: hypothetical protein ABR974_09910 [Bacteroidales bacterium]|jgi:hypothetical protein